MISNGAFFQSAVGVELTRQKMIELQAAMARDLNYAIDQFDVARTYSPTWLREEEDLVITERTIQLAAAKRQVATSGQPTPNSERSSSHVSEGGAIYLTRYRGQDGNQGVGTAFIGGGTIGGTDVAGIRFNGTYSQQGDRLVLSGMMDVPAGAQLVTGQRAAEPTSIPFTGDVPTNFATGQEHTISVGGLPVKISFEKVQDVFP